MKRIDASIGKRTNQSYSIIYQTYTTTTRMPWNWKTEKSSSCGMQPTTGSDSIFKENYWVTVAPTSDTLVWAMNHSIWNCVQWRWPLRFLRKTTIGKSVQLCSVRKTPIRSFQQLFLEMTSADGHRGIDPFQKCITIASACNLVFRTKFLRPDTIGISPAQGYRQEGKHSM
jgi:hypothetical protein